MKIVIVHVWWIARVITTTKALQLNTELVNWTDVLPLENIGKLDVISRKYLYYVFLGNVVFTLVSKHHDVQCKRESESAIPNIDVTVINVFVSLPGLYVSTSLNTLQWLDKLISKKHTQFHPKHELTLKLIYIKSNSIINHSRARKISVRAISDTFA